MKQLITRVPDDVLEACKRKAKTQGVSMNTFVNRLLAQAADADDRRRELLRRIEEAGWTVHIEPSTEPAPTYEEVLEMTRGSGTFILDELLRQRHLR